MRVKRFYSQLLSYLLTIVILGSLIPTAAFSASEETTPYDASTTAFMTSAYGNMRQIKIESYLTNKTTTEISIKPCDIIFVLDQSKWMNTEENAGAQRASILTAMQNLLNTLAAPTTGGEHRIAIAGYGRVNLGAVDYYDASVYPGAVSQSSNISFNTGYYTTKGFVSQNGWKDLSSNEFAGTGLPQMPDSYLAAMNYDNAFMTLDEASTVLNPDTMMAWYSGASRMDAGLTIAEQLATIAKEHDIDGDRNLIVCILASSLPIQHTVSTNQSIIRSNAVLAASELLKSEGATIFAFGDYHNSGRTMVGDFQDTEENFVSIMQSVCSTPDNFYSLNDYTNVTEAMNRLITQITITSAGEANQEYTITADQFTVSPGVEESLEGTIDQNGLKTVTWKKIQESYDDKIKTCDTNATIEFYNFTGYMEDGTPTFENDSHIEFEIPLADIIQNDSIVYPTTMIPIPPFLKEETDIDPQAYSYYGYKVVITIAEPITVSYEWASDSSQYAPTDVSLPKQETMALGSTHTTPTITTGDTHYRFDGWYLNKECTSSYSGETIPITNFTLYGKWTQYVLIEYYWDIWEGYDIPDSIAQIIKGNVPDIYTPNGVSGYMFDGWFLDKEYTQPYTPTSLTTDIKLYAKWIPNANTEYTVKFYQQNISDNGYTEISADKMLLTGKTDEAIAPITKSYIGFTLKNITYEDSTHSAQTNALPIKGDGSLIVKVYFDRNQYHVTYDGNGSDGGQVPVDNTAYRYGATVTIQNDTMTKNHYLFAYWTTTSTAGETISYDPEDKVTITADMTLVAQWVLDQNTGSGHQTSTYKVEHYKQQVDGSYSLTETEFPLYASINATVTATTKTWEHYHVNSSLSTLSGVVVSPSLVDDETVILTLKVYYDLDTLTVSYDLNNGSPASGVDYSSQTVRYGSTITVLAEPVRSGYVFTEWLVGEEGYQAGDHPEITSNITFVAQWIPLNSPIVPTVSAYKIEHYKQQVDGSYSLTETEFPLYASNNSTVTATTKTWEHYHVNSSLSTLSGVVVSPSLVDGETVILTLKVYYDLDTLTVSYDLNNGSPASGVDYSSQTVKYGSTITVLAEPVRSGYVFIGWLANDESYQSGDHPEITSDITFVAQWKSEPSNSEEENPKTGDNLPIQLWITWLVISSAVFVGVIVYGKRKRKRD
jgi:uncharacterized repeat protein (TIGR02543 family)